jgi:hypothetical protein
MLHWFLKKIFSSLPNFLGEKRKYPSLNQWTPCCCVMDPDTMWDLDPAKFVPKKERKKKSYVFNNLMFFFPAWKVFFGSTKLAPKPETEKATRLSCCRRHRLLATWRHPWGHALRPGAPGARHHSGTSRHPLQCPFKNLLYKEIESRDDFLKSYKIRNQQVLSVPYNVLALCQNFLLSYC